MLVHESRILQVTIFGTLQSNLDYLDFSLLLPDVMAIADEIDSQLTQSMDGYMKAMQKSAGSVASFSAILSRIEQRLTILCRHNSSLWCLAHQNGPFI
jgi:hypothetical protein